MRQLRLVGIHENGSSLQVSSDDGMSFELPVDDALRSAMAEIARSRAPRNRDESSVHTPREIQARVRAGASAYDLALEWDVPVESIVKYEGPVLAEREHIAELARRVEVSGPQTDAEYREVFGEEPADLGSMVAHRLHQLNINPLTARWDSWKDPEGQWIVTVEFDSPLQADNVEKLDNALPQPDNVARWSFAPGRKTLSNLNRWAQTLSEQVAPEYFRPVSAISQVEEPAAPAAPEPDETEELVSLLNARRGQRPKDQDPEREARYNEIIERGMSKYDAEEDESLPHLPQGISPRTSQLVVVTDADKSSGSAPKPAEEPSEDGAGRKAKRSSVPSWDDIMFGKRKKDTDS
ncbi:septation protein SepH [Glutamicibacter protophormiae]|uniref:septation protein SepH n=1 Tax=Glutamicibacter protophormiae TaxID=37930 RepID=UPI002A830658|nr:septation protein SepH [Glutamicibacter protophormiae]WPR63373.1 septation protein SepH [Glutamicibacter protophormiae]WPR66869.1 septation protein SepH [Glutamicibacter protophormiae]